MQRSLYAQTMGELEQFDQLQGEDADRIIQEELACSPVRTNAAKVAPTPKDTTPQSVQKVLEPVRPVENRLRMDVRPRPQVIGKSRSSSQGKKKVQFVLDAPSQKETNKLVI